VRVTPEGAEHFRLEVEDSGIGVRPDDVKRLFVEFQQLDASTAKKYAGTGLGLALTKRIVEAQGGQVGVRSAPGAGSVFFAVLPRETKAFLETERAAPARAAGGAPSVLVIEDDARDRRWIVAALSEAGYVVESATTGAEAVQRVREQAFGAITLDLLLPDMDGRDVLLAIRDSPQNRGTPVVVLTVVAERGAVAGFRVQAILTKPVSERELVDALRAAQPATGATDAG
jgi:CheY-like chemotaxis protein